MIPLRLGVSACLLGHAVRFDGGHKRHALLTEILTPFVSWVPVCPEEDAGLGTPREPMRLVKSDHGVRVLTVRTGRDVTASLRDAANRRVSSLVDAGLDGYIFKKDSPSCGVWRVSVYDAVGSATRCGRGTFAESILSAQPWLPVEEEGRLADPVLREHFFERAYAHQRLRQLLNGEARIADLMRFHARHKMQLLAHSPSAYRTMGRLVATADRHHLQEVLNAYRVAFLDALAQPASRARHVNVLQHITGFFRRLFGPDHRRELASAVADYQRALVPLIVPITLLTHYARVHGIEYLLEQCYLEPHPRELKLLNDV